jgi:hypothetical protein
MAERCERVCEEKTWLMAGAVKKSPLLEAVADWKDSVCAVMICKVWKSAMALQLSVFTSRVLRWLINPISNPKPRRQSLYLVRIHLDSAQRPCRGERDGVVVEALCYVADSGPEEVDFFNLSNPSRRTMALGSTQPLTEMNTRNLPGG